MFSFSPNTRARSTEVNQNFTELSNGIGDVDGNRLQLFRAETCFDFVQSGSIWTIASALTGTMTAGVAYIADGSSLMQRITPVLIASKVFTASKDTYVDLGSDGTIYYSEVATGATAPTLSANRIRIALIITNGATITEIFQTDQRVANTTLADRGWSGLDNLGNPVRNTSPFEMEFMVSRHNGTVTRSTIVAGADATLPNMSFNYKTGRTKEKISYHFGSTFINSVAGEKRHAVYVDGVMLHPMYYHITTGSQWYSPWNQTRPSYYSANTTIVVTFRGGSTVTSDYTNNSTDQQFTLPTIILRVKRTT